MFSTAIAATFVFSSIFAAEAAPAQPPAKKDKTAQAGKSAPIDLIWMVGPPSDVEPTGKPPRNTAKLRKRGANLYAKHCQVCHGRRGDGRGPQADNLDFKPTDFTPAVYKVRSTPSGTLPTDQDLYATISRGMHGTIMFPWNRLSEKDRWALVYRLKRFSPRMRAEKPGRSYTVPRPPTETEERVRKGAELYELLRCNTCHGPEGAGDGAAADLYANGRAGQPVKVRDFTAGQFLRGRHMEDIYLTLLTGLDGTPMGPYDTLSPEDLWSLAAYVRNLVRELPIPEVPQGWDIIERSSAKK